MRKVRPNRSRTNSVRLWPDGMTRRIRRPRTAKATNGPAAPSAYPPTATAPTNAPTSGGANRIQAPMPEAKKDRPRAHEDCVPRAVT